MNIEELWSDSGSSTAGNYKKQDGDKWITKSAGTSYLVCILQNSPVHYLALWCELLPKFSEK